MIIWAMIAFGVFTVILLCGCQNSNLNNNNTNNNTNNNATLTTFIIKEDGTFSSDECTRRGLTGMAIMFESKYCGYCKATLPYFQQACQTEGIEPIILDLSIPEHRAKMESYGLDIWFTPTFVFGCDYFIGARSEEDYLKVLKKLT